MKTAFGLRPRERIEARTLQTNSKNTDKNDLRTNTLTNPIFLQKVPKTIAPKSMKISPVDHRPGPVSPNPSI